MATLHVRNVPDEVYELLRERAAANDRSIAAEAVQLLAERLALAGLGAPRRLPLPGRRRGSGGLLTRFTDHARQAIVDAREEARGFGHDHVGTDHLLVGVLLRRERPAAMTLADLGLTAERARALIEQARGHGDASPPGQIPFEPGAKQALELALREALKLGHPVIGLEHITLGILDQETGPGAAMLRNIEPDAPALRERLLKPLGGASPGWNPPFSFEQMPYYRVVQLDGDAKAWEQQLNDGCPPGYDLVEIVDGRAILRRF